MEKFTDFGFERVSESEKGKRVAKVFDSVSSRYDLMNDLMSLGIHRFWKKIAVDMAGLRPGMSVLDLAGGTGDLSRRIANEVGSEGRIYLADINRSMLSHGIDKLMDHGLWPQVRAVQVNAEQLSFKSNTFDRIFIGFGLRNVTHKAQALKEMANALKPGGKLLVLEFSEPKPVLLKKLYDLYSFKVLPLIGKQVANDEASYRYLAESIRMHPNQEALKGMMIESGFDRCDYFNLSGGITAIHVGVKY
ncbi:MAG: class I SAM-dependent methyltransferase [Gammaproteobacteria bacterium]